MTPPNPTLHNAGSLIAHKVRRIHKLERDLAESKRQEAITHDSCHEWRKTAGTYYIAIEHSITLAEHFLSDGHSPQAVLDAITTYLREILETPPSAVMRKALAESLAQRDIAANHRDHNAAGTKPCKQPA